MGKHNDKQFTEGFKSMLRGGMKQQFQEGLRQGTFAACKVIHDKALNEEKTAEERLEDIVNFCEVFASLKPKNGQNSTDEGENANESTDPES